MLADQVLRTSRQVIELHVRDVDAQLMIQRGEDVPEMNRTGQRLLAPASGRAENLTSSHAATPDSRSAADLADAARDVADRVVAELLGNGAADLAPREESP